MSEGQETRASEAINVSQEPGICDASAVTMQRLQLCYATLCCLGGIVLAGVDETQTLPYIAVCFAVFGYIFVDWLALFALPPLLAYLAMGGVAIYCVGSFWDLDAPGNTQMISVAKLLVMVQCILMLQRKTIRIFEQLTVFCLLQLVVAAVFNHAMSYGLLLIPICLIAANSLGLVSSLSVNDSLIQEGVRPLFRRPEPAWKNKVFVSGEHSFQESSAVASRLPRTILLTIVPAIALVSMIFFYALPRTSDAARPDASSQSLVGFSDHLSLKQIGQMQQNGQLALRVRLRNQSDGSTPYLLRDGMYLRGKVLDGYRFRRSRRTVAAAAWMSSSIGSISANMTLPKEPVAEDVPQKTGFDRVSVDVTCESFRSPTLFAIAPYFELTPNKGVLHDLVRSTLHRNYSGERVYPRMRYEFLTHGFKNGVQTRLVPEATARSNPMAPANESGDDASGVDADDASGAGADDWTPVGATPSSLQFDPFQMPTAAEQANRLIEKLPSAKRNPYQIATAFEDYLSTTNEYRYTLNLDFPRVENMDPIEQFLSVDKAGHCQFFASAMVMMLRSQGIPSRIVVGYRSEEYNELGEYYTVRQLHAHAWVEALISERYVGSGNGLHRSLDADSYWVRFDPTPSFTLAGSVSPGSVSQVFDLAQNIWDDYVVDMDGQRQSGALGSGAAGGSMFASYGRFFSWVEMRINNIRAGQLGGGSLAAVPGFSWTAAAFTIGMGVLLFGLIRIPLRRRGLGVSAQASAVDLQRPRYEFYQETLSQLARLGIKREVNVTPSELAQSVGSDVEHPERSSLTSSLDTLTKLYNRVRYGQDWVPSDEKLSEASNPVNLGEPEKSQVEHVLKTLRREVDDLTAEKEPVQ